MTVGVINAFTVIVIGFEITKLGDAQFTELVISHSTISLFNNDTSAYEAEFVPTFTPFFFH